MRSVPLPHPQSPQSLRRKKQLICLCLHITVVGVGWGPVSSQGVISLCVFWERTMCLLLWGSPTSGYGLNQSQTAEPFVHHDKKTVVGSKEPAGWKALCDLGVWE